MSKIISYTLLSIFITVIFVTTVGASQSSNINACLDQVGYFCSPSGTVNNGQVSLTKVGQDTGVDFYNVEFACTTNYSIDTYKALEYPQPTQIQNDWVYAQNSALPTWDTTSITNLQCYGNNGNANYTIYGGNIWISYTLSNTISSSSNPRYDAFLGSFTVSSSTSTSSSTSSTSSSSTSTVSTSTTTINSNIPPSLSVTPNPVAANHTTNVSVTSSYANHLLIIFINGTSKTGSAGSFSVTYKFRNAGNYTIQAEDTNTSLYSKTVNLVVQPNPVTTPTVSVSPNPAKANQNVTISGQASAGDTVDLIINGSIVSGNTTIDTISRRLSSGTYKIQAWDTSTNRYSSNVTLFVNETTTMVSSQPTSTVQSSTQATTLASTTSVTTASTTIQSTAKSTSSSTTTIQSSAGNPQPNFLQQIWNDIVNFFSSL